MNAETKKPDWTGNAMSQANNKQMKQRGAFTLIELLVAITIFVILLVLTLGAFNLNIGSERVRSASRQVQAMLEGAKSRAFKFQKPVGVRFILDENNPSEITGMMYIEGQDNLAGGNFETGSLRYVKFVHPGPGPLKGTTVEGIQYASIQGTTSLSWKEMSSIGQIEAGVKIRIPAKTGKWYTVSSDLFLADPNQRIMRLTVPLLGVTNWGSLTPSLGDKTDTYELDLSMVMGAMPGEDPVAFPKGIVIELKSSKVPRNWNVNRWIAGRTYLPQAWVVGVTGSGLRAFQTSAGGVTGGSEPAWPSVVGNTVVDGTVTWRCYEVPRFDIIFTPQGTVMGSVVAEGLLHLTLAETRDTHAIFEDDPTTSPAGQTTIGVPVWDLRDHNNDGEKPEHIGSFRVITVFPASGSVNVSPLDQTDVRNNITGALTPDEFADSIFRYAIEGSTAK